MPLSAEEFFQSDKPNYLQQGDILTGVPLFTLPAHRELIIARTEGTRRPIRDLQAGSIEITRELAINDAFEHGFEYVVVSAERAAAVLMTPTCDLADLDTWFVCPLHEMEGSGINEGNLKAGKYANLFYVPTSDHFEESYADFGDIRPISGLSVDLTNRIASMSREAQKELVDRFIATMGRAWGFAPGEMVEPIGKYQTGRFRCARCNMFDVPASESAPKPGMKFEQCPQCEKIGKQAQWYPLSKHRKY